MGGLTSNLHLILASFYLPDKSGTGRHKIIYEANAFSSAASTSRLLIACETYRRLFAVRVRI